MIRFFSFSHNIYLYQLLIIPVRDKERFEGHKLCIEYAIFFIPKSSLEIFPLVIAGLTRNRWSSESRGKACFDYAESRHRKTKSIS